LAAEDAAARTLTPSLLNHSYRTYRFGRALGALEGLEVDEELLFAAALLHDTGTRSRTSATGSTTACCAGPHGRSHGRTRT
jgi:HD superfamily phosphodiesterase